MTSIAEASASPARRVRPFAIAVGVVVAISVAAYAGQIPSFVAAHGVDKVLHATMGATLTFLLTRALRGRAAVAAVMVMIPLALDEYLQRFSATRSSDWGDLAADVTGVMLGVILHHARTLRRC